MSKNNLIFGLHSVTSLLEHHPEKVLQLTVLEERNDSKIDSLIKLARRQSISVEFSPRRLMDRMSDHANHQGVIATCKAIKSLEQEDLVEILQQIDEPPFLLILDSVQDPHNLGACFRTADAAGVHAIIAPKDKSVGITPVVTKVASGATETVPFIQVTNLVRALEMIKELGIWIYGADADTKQTIYETNLSGPIALVLGAEGSGLRRLTREHCDGLVNIPMYGKVESLNVSVATGICLFEAARQRHKTR